MYLPRILAGEDGWCLGFSEPGAGSDLAGITCRAEACDGEWVINGRMETEVNAPAKAVELPEVQRIPARRARYIRDERDPNAFLVHRSVFTSPEILARERELVFSKCWIYVGHGSEIPNPGDFVTRQVAGRPIIMTRDRDNQVRIHFNACTHRGAEVCRELRGNTRRFRCFYHSWSFDSAGAVEMPDEEGYPAGLDRAAHALNGRRRSTPTATSSSSTLTRTPSRCSTTWPVRSSTWTCARTSRVPEW
jgi:nitrite reductase/ring-hydroxylating ferredoxin subunit